MLAKQKWYNVVAFFVISGAMFSACGTTPVAPDATTGPVAGAATSASQPAAPPATTTTTASGSTAMPDQPPADTAASGVRALNGKLTVAIQGAVPVEGAPLTRTQKAWQKALNKYRELQPSVELNVIDVPAQQNGEQFCATLVAGNQMPDVSLINECNYFRPTAQEIADGTSITTDFKPFEDEINPYTGKPWRDDWISDALRTGRCTEAGAVNTWTCQTVYIEASGIYVNLDILKEYGYDALPGSFNEIWALSDTINKDGKYAAWDNYTGSHDQFARSVFTSLAMDRFVEAGGDLNNLAGWTQDPNFSFAARTEDYCKGIYWSSTHPSIQESLRQVDRFVEASPGGSASYFDPAREQHGQLWLSGQAAFRYAGNNELSSILQAQDDGVFNVKNWTIGAFSKITKDDLIDKDVEIAFDGDFWNNFGGNGDVFAPTANVRASGEDANVDLMARDFLQFLSSPAGQQRILDMGLGIPINPEVFKQANDPRLEAWLAVKPKRFEGVTQPPGGAFSNDLMREPEKNLAAWMTGIIDFESATKLADESATRTLTKRLEDELIKQGKALPAACEPFASR